MKIFSSLLIAFSMYSRIPVPIVEWKEENMKYAVCYFPLIGFVIGILQVGVQWICLKIGLGNLLRSILLCILPIIITGGIHMDGYLDTIDALSSHQSKEKKLVILKDSHIGAFAFIYGSLYFLISIGLYSEIYTIKQMLVIGLGFILSRASSGLALVILKNAKENGTLTIFRNAAYKRFTEIIMIIYIILVILITGYINFVLAFLIVLMQISLFFYYHYMSLNKFGGITGDLAGWFLQMLELGILALVVLMKGLI